MLELIYAVASGDGMYENNTLTNKYDNFQLD